MLIHGLREGTGIWTSTMRENMRKRLGPDFPEATLLKLYGNLRTIRTYARTTPTRIAVTKGIYILYFFSQIALDLTSCSICQRTKRRFCPCSSLRSSYVRPVPLLWTRYPQSHLNVIIAFLPLVCAVLMTNFYLGDTQNAVDGTGIDGRKMADPMNVTEEEAEIRRQDPNSRLAGRRWGLGRWRV